MLNENRFLGTFRGHNTRTNFDAQILMEILRQSTQTFI